MKILLMDDLTVSRFDSRNGNVCIRNNEIDLESLPLDQRAKIFDILELLKIPIASRAGEPSERRIRYDRLIPSNRSSGVDGGDVGHFPNPIVRVQVQKVFGCLAGSAVDVQNAVRGRGVREEVGMLEESLQLAPGRLVEVGSRSVGDILEVFKAVAIVERAQVQWTVEEHVQSVLVGPGIYQSVLVAKVRQGQKFF